MESWRIGPADVLLRCRACAHVVRDLASCPGGARVPAYGGDPGLDRVRLALTYRQVRRALPGRTGRVFEVGFGSAALLRRFLDDGIGVGGTDPGGLDVQVDARVARQGSVTSLPLEQVSADAGYDLVYGVHVVEHVEDARAFVRAAVRLLVPGGVLLLITPAGDSAGLRWFRSSWWMLEDPTHVRFFSGRSLVTLLRQEGLADVSVSRPVLDSLAVEAASVVRRVRAGRLPPAGVLPLWSTRLAVLVSLPLVLLARLARPRWRPTLQVTARRPGPP